MIENKAEKILPFEGESRRKGEQVEEMFDSIAPKYDLLNHTLSFGIDKFWRRCGLKRLKKFNPQSVLDIATGTGDLAIKAYEHLHPMEILGVDISEGMMNVAREKVAKLNLSDMIKFQREDCMCLTFPNESYDAAIVAFGVRNFENLTQGITEIARVLKTGGHLMILELTTPQRFPMKQLYTIYSKLVIPTIGKIVSKDSVAYNYLPKTIKAFTQGEEMRQVLLSNGFSEAYFKRYTFGICTMYMATK